MSYFYKCGIIRFTLEVLVFIWIYNLDSLMFVAGMPTQEKDIVEPKCAQKTVSCFITRLPLVSQILNLRFFKFRCLVGILTLRSKLRHTCMYTRKSGSYSPPFCFRTTSSSFAYRFLPSVKHIQITLHLFFVAFFSFGFRRWNCWRLRLFDSVWFFLFAL